VTRHPVYGCVVFDVMKPTRRVSEIKNMKMYIMKYRIGVPLGLAIVAGVLGIQSVARCADAPAKEAGLERSATVRDRMHQLAAELNLTDAQKQKLRPIVREEMGKVHELRKDTTLSRREKMERFRALQQEMQPKVKAVLTEEQFAKWQEKRKEMRKELRAEGRKRAGNK
jgi:Spy/CpxP family protein refolding chaperone